MTTLATLGAATRPLMVLLLAGAAMGAATGAVAAPTVYATRAPFEAALGTSDTDGYDAPGYVFDQGDVAMSGVRGETDYTATGFPNANRVFVFDADRLYCAGCNGSFRLTFTTTSVGSAAGVYGAGFDYFNFGGPAYVAFVTFGDDTTAEYALSTGPGVSPQPFFFGVTSDTLIKSIHLGLPGGGSTQMGVFAIDDLTIGAAPTAVPAPGTAALLGLALAAAAGMRRRRPA